MLENPVYSRLIATFHALRSTEHEITWRQIAALAHVAQQPNCSVREIAAGLGLSKPVVTRALQALQRQRMLTSEPSEKDKRLVKARITSNGRSFLQRLMVCG